MGCWNGSCALTGLPINVNQDVYVFLLVQRSANTVNNHCHPDTYWAPIPYHFTGKYNDYGSVEECEGPLLDHIVNGIRDQLHEVEVGENKYHDIAVKRDAFNIDLLFQADREHRLAIYGRAGPLYAQRVTHLIVHKAVFDQLLDSYKVRSWQHQGYRSYQELINDTIPLIDKLFEDSTSDSEDYLLDIASEELTIEQWQAIRRISRNNINRQLFETSLVSSLTNIAQIDGFNLQANIFECVDKGDKPKIYHLVEQVAKMIILTNFMYDARRMWTPMSGAGSQNDCTYAQTLMAEITQTQSIAFNQWYKEDEDE